MYERDMEQRREGKCPQVSHLCEDSLKCIISIEIQPDLQSRGKIHCSRSPTPVSTLFCQVFGRQSQGLKSLKRCINVKPSKRQTPNQATQGAEAMTLKSDIHILLRDILSKILDKWHTEVLSCATHFEHFADFRNHERA